MHGKPYLYLLLPAAVIATGVMTGPASAQQPGKAKVVSEDVREKCRAQMRATGNRLRFGGTAWERHTSALLRQCIANGGRL